MREERPTLDTRQRIGRYGLAIGLVVAGILAGTYTGSILFTIIGPLAGLLLAAATFGRDR